MSKYSGINEINKAAFDAIVPKVNEAIEKGEIAIPVDKAKLYKHTIEFIKGDNQKLTISIKSYSSTPLTKETTEQFIRNEPWFSYNDGTTQYAIIISIEIPDIIYMAQNQDDVLVYQDFDVSDEGEEWTIVDTVTPLGGN